MSNVIEITWGNSDLAYIDATEYDYNYGMELQLNDSIEDGIAYEMHFSNQPSGESINAIVSSDGVVSVPNSVWDNSENQIYAYLFVVGDGYGYTDKELRIVKRRRSNLPDDIEPSDEEQALIDALLAEIRQAVAQTTSDVFATTTNATASAESAESASERAESASASATSAQGYAETATTKASEASTSASNASTSEGNAQTYASNAEQSATSASASAQSASASAQSASESAESARTSATTATTKASEASASAQTASDKASEASTSASTASAKATESAQSASNAQTYASNAENAKTSAQTAQEVAESARDEAVTAKNDTVTAKESVDALVGDLAKEQTQKRIESGTDELVTLMRQIVEEGQSAGDLNGFSLSLGVGNEVVLTYTDEETQESVSAVAVTNTTGLAIASAFEDLVNTWKEAVTNGNS